MLLAGVLAASDSILRQSPANVRPEKPATRDGLSLAHGDCFFRAAAVRSMLLAYRFEAVLNQFSTRSVQRSHPRSLTRPGKIHALYPLPNLFSSIPDRFQDRHSPPGFTPSGSKCSIRLQPGGLPLRSARSPFAPRAALVLIAAARIIVPGSLLLARLALKIYVSCRDQHLRLHIAFTSIARFLRILAAGTSLMFFELLAEQMLHFNSDGVV